MEQECRFFFAAVFYGAELGLFYDLQRSVRITWEHRRWLVAVQDLLFGAGTGIYLFSRVYRWNYGVIRWYFLAGVFLGMLAYGAAISQFVLKFVSFLLKRLKMFFSWGNIILKRIIKAFYRILGIKNGENVKAEKEKDACP